MGNLTGRPPPGKGTEGQRGAAGALQPPPSTPQRGRRSCPALERCEETHAPRLYRGCGGRFPHSPRKEPCPAGHPPRPSPRQRAPGRQKPVSLKQGTRPVFGLTAWKAGRVPRRELALCSGPRRSRCAPARTDSYFPNSGALPKRGVGTTEDPLCPVLAPRPARPGVGESRRRRRRRGGWVPRAPGQRPRKAALPAEPRPGGCGGSRLPPDRSPPPRALWRGRAALAAAGLAGSCRQPRGSPRGGPPPPRDLPGSPPPGRRRAAGPLCRPRRGAAPRAAPGGRRCLA